MAVNLIQQLPMPRDRNPLKRLMPTTRRSNLANELTPSSLTLSVKFAAGEVTAALVRRCNITFPTRLSRSLNLTRRRRHQRLTTGIKSQQEQKH
jgi:hypothetical protein